jgi:two-component system NtrC family sensor kinase
MARKKPVSLRARVEALEKRLQRENARRKRVERTLVEALDRQKATSDILQVISRSPTDVQPVFDAIVHSAARLLRGDGGILTRVVGDYIELVAFTSSGPAGDEALKAGFPLSVHVPGSIQGLTIRDRAPFVFTDYETDSR